MKMLATLTRVAVVCLAFLLPTLTLAADNAASGDSKKLAETQANIDQLKQQLEELKTKRADLQKQVQDADASIATTTQKVEDPKKQIKSQEKPAKAKK